MNNKDKIYEVTIIGAGPAGIACAIQLKRYGIEYILLEKNEVGGLLRNANLVENYAGFPEGISGGKLVGKFKEHIKNLDVPIVFEEVQKVENNNEIFEIKTNNTSYKSNFLTIASGTRPKPLLVEVDEVIKNKIFYEVCNLYKHEIKGKTVVIIGSGDAAFDYAINLASDAKVKEVIILNRSSKTKCLGILKKQAAGIAKIKYIENEEPVKIAENSGMLSIICRNGREIESDYLLVAIGREPNLEFINFSKELEFGNRLFFIGDVKNDIFRQTSIAVGDGVKVAMEIHINRKRLQV